MEQKALTLPLVAAVLAVSLLSIGAPCLAHDDPGARVAELTEEIAKEPPSASRLLERAELHRLRGDWQSGLADLQAARAIDPALPAVDLALARLMYDAGNATAARDAAERFVAASPENVTGHVVLARTLAKLGEDGGAAAAMTRAIVLDREQRGDASRIQPDDFLLRAQALVRAGRIDEALAGLDEGIAALGAPVSLEIHAARIEEEAGRYDGALTRIARLEATARRKEAWMSRRGDLLARAGRGAEAREAWQQSLATIAALAPAFRRSPAMRALDAELSRKLGAPAAPPDERAALATKPSDRRTP